MNTGLRLTLLWIKLCTKRQIHQSVTKESLDSHRASDIDLTFRSKSTLVAVRRCRFVRVAKCHELLAAAYAGRLCSYWFCASRADWSLGSLRKGSHSIGIQRAF
jgi:hypothetical protein